jgi:hypothetical protein
VWIGPTTSQAEWQDAMDCAVNVTKRHVEALGVPVLGHRVIAEAPTAREVWGEYDRSGGTVRRRRRYRREIVDRGLWF